MKKNVRLIAIFCLLLLLLSGCKGETTVESFDMTASADDLLKSAPLIFLGVVTGQQTEGHYRNETVVHKDADGDPMYNYWVTPYSVRVLEVYKGALAPEVKELTVSTLNLYSDEDMKAENSKAKTLYLKKGDKMIFCVCYEAADESYVPLLDGQGLFKEEKDGKYCNSVGVVLHSDRMEGFLQTAEKYGADLFANTSYQPVIKKEHQK